MNYIAKTGMSLNDLVSSEQGDYDSVKMMIIGGAQTIKIFKMLDKCRFFIIWSISMDSSFVKPLILWYNENSRKLPWRETKDPYRIWVSEIMLQQTRVEAVTGYYQRFTEALPTVYALAACPEDQLLKLWEGLGYYSRARNLQRAARIICEEYGGKLPHTAAELKRLPGIGDYTAGAIASIAFGEAEPAVDGNILRVYARLTALEEDILRDAVRKKVRGELRAAHPEADGSWGLLNQAFMDLGSGIRSRTARAAPFGTSALRIKKDGRRNFRVGRIKRSGMKRSARSSSSVPADGSRSQSGRRTVFWQIFTSFRIAAAG